MDIHFLSKNGSYLSKLHGLYGWGVMSWITCNLFFLISFLFSLDIESLPFACTDVQPSNFKAFFGNGVFFFLISKKKILLIKARETQKVHGSEQWKKKQQDKNSPYSILIEEIKSVREEQSEKPQQRDQSKRVFWQNSNNWTTDFSDRKSVV